MDTLGPANFGGFTIIETLQLCTSVPIVKDNISCVLLLFTLSSLKAKDVLLRMDSVKWTMDSVKLTLTILQKDDEQHFT